MFKLIRRHKREPAYKSFETGVVYEKFKGGFSWPMDLPGFVCVVGQESEGGVLKILAEFFDVNLTDLARRCGTLQSLYHFSDWTAQKEGEFKSYDDALYKFAKDDSQSIYLIQPSIAWDLNLAVQLVKRELRQNTLLLPQKGILVNQIEKIDKEASLSEPEKMVKYEPVMVLASIINEFESLPKRLEKNRPRDAWADVWEDEDVPGVEIW